MLEWTLEPADTLDASATQQAVSAARRAINARRVQATRCLDGLQGVETPAATVPDVECKAASPEWYRSKESATWLTLILGLLTAIVAALGLKSRYGFRKSPTG